MKNGTVPNFCSAVMMIQMLSLKKGLERQDIRMLLPLFPNPSLHSD